MPLFVLRIAEGGAADVDRRLRVSLGDFVCVIALHPSQLFFSNVGTISSFSGLNQYLAQSV